MEHLKRLIYISFIYIEAEVIPSPKKTLIKLNFDVFLSRGEINNKRCKTGDFNKRQTFLLAL